MLSSCSEYFEELFRKTDCKHPIIILKDIDPQDLETLLNYIYLGEVHVLSDRLVSLIQTAECLKIKGLSLSDVPLNNASQNKSVSSNPSFGDKRYETSLSNLQNVRTDDSNSDQCRSFIENSFESNEFTDRIEKLKSQQYTHNFKIEHPNASDADDSDQVRKL